MNLKHLTDSQLLLDVKTLVQKERVLLTQVLHHLHEVEKRKLFSSLGYKSLFEYTCIELKYSSDQAYRRIQAMRLLKEIPEAVKKIDSGELTLTNINQAQRFFNENKVSLKKDKITVLKKLVNKSARDGQKELLKMSPQKPLPQETKKQVTPTHTQVSFNMSEDLEQKLESVKSLLGPKAYNMSMADLIEAMADLASKKLQENKFGKKCAIPFPEINCLRRGPKDSIDNTAKGRSSRNKEHLFSGIGINAKQPFMNVHNHGSDNKKYIKTKPKNSRYVSAKLKHHIWFRDKGACVKCSSKTNLNLDHIKPFALGGKTTPQNLRILCFNCNQRRGIEEKLIALKG